MKITGLRFYSIVFLLVMIFLKAGAQLPVPVIECVSFLDETTLRVTWSVPHDPLNDHEGFRIQPYSASNSSIYFEPVIINDTTKRSADFSILTPGGILPDQYKIEIYTYKYTPNGIVNSLNPVPRYSIFLEFGASTNEGKAVLNWGRNQSLYGSFTIKRKTEAGTFETIGSTTNEYSYEDIITAPYCEPTPLYYQVEFSSSLGSCSANSSVAIRIFADITYPEDPILNLVTIKDEKAEVHWINSPSGDVAAYIIQMRNSAGTWDVLATVNSNINPYLDDSPAHNPCAEVLTYIVRAEDECGIESPGTINYLNPHNTILLSVKTDSNCGRKATLTWNAYKNMTPPVSQYKIFRGEYLVSQNEIEIGHVDASGDTQYSFTDETLLPSNDYVYYVRAVNADPAFDEIRSESCRIPVTIDFETPTTFELDNLTVENDHINLNIEGLPVDLIDSVAIYRSATDAAALELLITNDWGGSSPFIIPEQTAEVHEMDYYYQIVALDACGFELARTGVSRSIYLELRDNGNGNIRLDWNAYEGWDPGELVRYDFYRLENGVVAAGFPVPTTNLYFDDETTGTEAGAVTYYVEAVRERNGETTTSRSNEVLLPAEAVVTVPNAFRPGGLIEDNREFKPSVTNIEPDSYLFAIYNRWGQLVFETNDPTRGWNGQIKGREALRDIYAWVISYTDLTGIKASKRGSVILVR